MPMTISPLRKARLKRELLNPKNSVRQALKNAGYADKTAHQSTNNPGVKICMAEIQEEITEANVRARITPEYVLKELTRIRDLAEANKDFSTATRNNELLGKFLAMFTDKSEVSTVEKEENAFSVLRLAKLQTVKLT